MSYRNIQAVIQPFKLIDDSLNFNIRHLSFKEKSGLHVVDFYAKQGFEAKGDRFYECNIPHFKMVKNSE